MILASRLFWKPFLLGAFPSGSFSFWKLFLLEAFSSGSFSFWKFLLLFCINFWSLSSFHCFLLFIFPITLNIESFDIRLTLVECMISFKSLLLYCWENGISNLSKAFDKHQLNNRHHLPAKPGTQVRFIYDEQRPIGIGCCWCPCCSQRLIANRGCYW